LQTNSSAVYCSGEQKNGACGGKEPWCFCDYVHRTWCWCNPNKLEKAGYKCLNFWCTEIRFTEHAQCESGCGWR